MVPLSVPAADTPYLSDTIVAVSTAAGVAHRGIVRLSGPDALRILRDLLPPESRARIPRRNYRFLDSALLFDGMAFPARIYLMRAPASYTREDIVEIHTFGAPPVLDALLDALRRCGCRPAAPGEFTRRAFLNGRIDLAQAEAVEALIHTRGEAEFRAASAALAGRLSRRLEALRAALLDLAAQVEASLDFSDQDVEIISAAEVAAAVEPLRAEIARLLAGREQGRVARVAVRAVLFGPPNAGKSSLFNAILKAHRAIVSPHPGTTRDTLEAATSVAGLEVTLVDTAGLREAVEEVERMAVSRSRDAAQRADVGLCVLDAQRPPDAETRLALGVFAPGRDLLLLNKADLGPCRDDLRILLPEAVEAFAVSAATGQGIEGILRRLRERLEDGCVDRAPDALMVTARQADLLRRALEALDRAHGAGRGPAAMDLGAADVRDALDAVAELLGRSPDARLVSEAVLDRIFASFCIGK